MITSKESIIDSSDMTAETGQGRHNQTCKSVTDTAWKYEANNDSNVEQYLMTMTEAKNGIKQCQVHVTVYF